MAKKPEEIEDKPYDNRKSAKRQKRREALKDVLVKLATEAILQKLDRKK